MQPMKQLQPIKPMKPMQSMKQIKPMEGSLGVFLLHVTAFTHPAGIHIWNKTCLKKSRN